MLAFLAQIEAGGGRPDAGPVIARLVRAEVERLLGCDHLCAEIAVRLGSSAPTEPKELRDVAASVLRAMLTERAGSPLAPLPEVPEAERGALWCATCAAYIEETTTPDGLCISCLGRVDVHNPIQLRGRIRDLSTHIFSARAQLADVERKLGGYGEGGSSPPAALLSAESKYKTEIAALEDVRLRTARALESVTLTGLAPLLAGVDPGIILSKMFADLGIDLTPAGRELAARPDR